MGAVCHGRARGPLEPIGRVAPLVRAVAWSVISTGSLAVLAAAAGYAAAGPRDAVAWSLLGGIAAISIGATLRFIAAFTRPDPLVLPARSVSRR